MGELNIIHTAIENLDRTAGISVTWKELQKGEFDGVITLNTKGKRIVFNVEIKNELRNYQLNTMLNRAQTNRPIIIVANKIFPSIKENLRELNIAYLEANGNVYINHADTLIWIDGNKSLPVVKNTTNRVFTKTGLKIVFHFLLEEYLINYPQRQIARLTQVGLGNINIVLKGLKELNFIIRVNENEYKLTDKKKLLEKWIVGYDEKLKPKLEIGTFRFLKENDFINWRNVKLRNMKTWWGGEPAGDFLTNHLRPGELTLYTIETRTELIKNYRLVPDKEGNVKVFKKFWTLDDVNDNIVPSLLIYTDLINKHDKRCNETAEIIYNELIKKDI